MKQATQFAIERWHRRDVGYVASLDDFTVSRQGLVDAAILTSNPNISLYCFAAAAREAVFVELPASVDLTQVPFVYQSQFELAHRVYTLPWSLFIELAQNLAPVDRPIFIHITGRSGSTLLNHAFNQTAAVKSLSEPDVISQFTDLRLQADPIDQPTLQQLADSTMRFLFKAHQAPEIEAHAVKFRNQGTLVMDIFQTAFPQGKTLFLYRDVEGFVTSFQRLLRKAGRPEQTPYLTWEHEYHAYLAGDLSHMRHFVGGAQVDLSIAQQLTLWWVAVIEWYLSQRERGVPALSVSFEALVGQPRQTLTDVLRYCGLATDHVVRGLRAYERDSQAGTAHARENPDEANRQLLTPDERAAVQAIIASHPVLCRPDFTMP